MQSILTALSGPEPLRRRVVIQAPFYEVGKSTKTRETVQEPSGSTESPQRSQVSVRVKFVLDCSSRKI